MPSIPTHFTPLYPWLLYKAMYSFSAISLALAVGSVILDYTVMKEDAVAGIYQPLEGKAKAVKI